MAAVSHPFARSVGPFMLVHRPQKLHRWNRSIQVLAIGVRELKLSCFHPFRRDQSLGADFVRAKVEPMDDSGNNSQQQRSHEPKRQRSRLIAHVRPARIRVGQSLVRWFFRILLLVLYRVRVHGLENYPATDGALICANHQSNLDPIVMGVSCPRPVNYLAKQSLFRWGPMGWFLRWNDAIPIDRSGAGIGGMKETLRRLKRGESVVIFPEGSRSIDGELQPLKQGFCSLARRTSAALVPVAIEGTYDAMPPKCKTLRLGRIHLVFGPQILAEDYQDLDDDQLTQLLEQRITDCFALAREKYRA
jgi:1-acyl-sn-glycerol-3-phosphate acyltransferase